MADVPAEISYGQITGRFVTFRADGPDAGDTPDEVPLSGTVTLTPSVNLVRFPTLDPPRIAAISSITAQVVSGELKSPDGTGGLFVIATDQPLGQPDTVQWKATFNLAGASTQPAPVTFNVPAGGVVDLVTVIPAAPAPGTVTVVSAADRELAQQAAVEARGYRDDAASSADAASQAASTAASQAVTDVRGELEDLLDAATLSDTGWVSFTPSSGWTASTTYPPQYRIKNGVVYFRGAVSSPSGTGTRPTLLLPAETFGQPRPRIGLLAAASAPLSTVGWVTFPEGSTQPAASISSPAVTAVITDLDLSGLTWPL